MKFQEALETGLAIRRKGWTYWYDAASEYQVLHVVGPEGHQPEANLLATRNNLLATDWEVQYPKIELTREEFVTAYLVAEGECVFESCTQHTIISRMTTNLFGASKCNP